MAGVTVGGTLETLPVKALDLDWQNPRLPAELRREDATQKELALYIDKHHDALRVARSIDRHGFFVSEPLIGIRNGRRTRIVEGNRRLVALAGLTKPALRRALEAQTPAWTRLGTLPADAKVPVVVVEERNEVDALLGFRHISGIEPWDPYAQARFIAELVERNGNFAEVAQIVGRTETEVRSMYRDFDIVAQAKSRFGLDTTRVERSFGVFNAAMGLVKLRAYIGAPAPREVDPELYPIAEDGTRELSRLFEYLFGDERGRGRAITDSRQLRTLARVLADESGTAERVLRETKDLQAALEATESHEDGARAQLHKAERALKQAGALISEGGFDVAALEPLVDECRRTLDGVAHAINRRRS